MSRRSPEQVEAEFSRAKSLLSMPAGSLELEAVKALEDEMPLLGDGITHLGYRRDAAGNRIEKPTRVDVETLAGADMVFTEDQVVADALRTNHGIRVASPRRITRYIKRLLTTNPWTLRGQRLMLGFSGYATRGYEYKREEQGTDTILRAFFGHTAITHMIGERPAAVVNGGTASGIPLIASSHARYFSMPSIGVAPRQGIDSLAPNDVFIIRGRQFGEETDLIGMIPDVLVVSGGGPNSEKEYTQALDAGCTVVLAIMKRDQDYPENSVVRTYASLPQTAQAIAEGRLIVCRDDGTTGRGWHQLQDALTTLLANKREIIKRRAIRRQKVIQALLSAPQPAS